MHLTTVSHLISAEATKDFEDLFHEHYQLVYRTAYGITGRPEDAEDVLQTIFLKLLRRGASPDFQKNPKGYLYRAAVNRSLDVLETRRRQLPAGNDPVEDVRTEASVDPYGITHQQLAAALSKLRPRAVEILILRYTHDCSDVEIAKLLGTSRGVVAVSLFRARARLKKLLGSTPREKKES